jgi:hypothetical protein
MANTDLTTNLQTPVGITVEQLQHYGLIFYQSGMFPDIRSAAQAEVKVMAGYELGFSPIYAMTKIYIVKGRVMVGAEALGAMVKRSGRYDYSITTLTDTECELEFTDSKQAGKIYKSKFTMEDAKRADLVKPDSGWIKWPRALLMSKALSQGARAWCPDAISGAYTPEDFGYSTNPASGQIDGEIENNVPKVIIKPNPVPQTPEIKAAMQTAVEKHDPMGDAARKQMQTVVDNADTPQPIQEGAQKPATAAQDVKQAVVIPEGDRITAAQLNALNVQKAQFEKIGNFARYNTIVKSITSKDAVTFAELTKEKASALYNALKAG